MDFETLTVEHVVTSSLYAYFFWITIGQLFKINNDLCIWTKPETTIFPVLAASAFQNQISQQK